MIVISLCFFAIFYRLGKETGYSKASDVVRERWDEAINEWILSNDDSYIPLKLNTEYAKLLTTLACESVKL